MPDKDGYLRPGNSGAVFYANTFLASLPAAGPRRAVAPCRAVARPREPGSERGAELCAVDMAARLRLEEHEGSPPDVDGHFVRLGEIDPVVIDASFDAPDLQSRLHIGRHRVAGLRRHDRESEIGLVPVVNGEPQSRLDERPDRPG